MRCQICNHSLPFSQNVRKCVLCENDGCKECVQPNGICNRCASRIPKAYRNKYLIWSIAPPIILFVLSLVVLSYGAYQLTPWMVLPFPDFLSWENSSISYICLILWLVLTIFAFKYPPFGAMKYKKWLNNIDNLQIIEGEIKRYKETLEDPDLAGTHSPKFSSLLRNGFFIFSLMTNGGMLWIYLISNNSEFQDLWLLADILAWGSMISNVLILIVACNFNETESIPKWWKFLRTFWVNLIILEFILAYGGQIYVIPSIGGLFYAAEDWLAFLLDFQNILIIVLYSSMIILTLDVMVAKKISSPPQKSGALYADLEISNKATENSLELSMPRWTPRWKIIFEKIWSTPIKLLLGILLLVIIAAGYILVIGDYFMMISFFSVAIAFGLVIPVVLWWLQIIITTNHEKRKKNRAFGSIVKVGFIFGGIFLFPVASVPLTTNPSLDIQFSRTFGPAWEQLSTEKHFERLQALNLQYIPFRSTRYSFFDNLFNFNTTANSRFNIPYLSVFPPRIIGNTSTVIHNFYFDAYLPPSLPFEILSPNPKLPVIIMMHGEVEDKGAWNANMTSQYLARQGYLVCDLNYGYLRTNNLGNNYTGYYFRDLVEQIGNFTQYLDAHSEEYHADISKVFFSGRHLGGGLALLCGMGYNTTLQHYFPSNLQVSGIIPFYPVSDIGTDSDFFQESVRYFNETLIKGSSDPLSPDYNADWHLLNPIELLDGLTGTIAPMFFITGTHDWIISIRYSTPFIEMMRTKGHTFILGEYLWGNDGFDGAHVSPYGQSVLYYLERFLALTI